MPTVLVPVADGSEEIETTAIVDTLRRADLEVTLASVGPDLTVTASRGVRLVADARLGDVADRHFDLIALPGGMPGAEHLAASGALRGMLAAQHSRQAWIGAICAAPAVVLQPQGLLDGHAATCHPGFFEHLDPVRRREDRVVVDAHLVTSRGPGTAIEFALELIAQLLGREARDRVAGPMLVRE
jgi:4-methyl-5(b-hydroxyethyl)-thiazole monophosphate biosynthesis